MKMILTSHLMRKCLILAFLVIGLIFVATSNKLTQPVAADSACCEWCMGSGDPAQIEPYCGNYCFLAGDYDTCFNDCELDARTCYSHCVYCDGGPDGGECNSSSDCASGYCGADGVCHSY